LVDQPDFIENERFDPVANLSRLATIRGGESSVVERVFKHVVRYPNIGAASIDDIAAALVANDRFAKRLPALIEALAPGLNVDQLTVEFRKLEKNGLIEEVLVHLLTTYQKQIEGRIVEGVETLTGIEISEGSETLVSVLIVLVALFAAREIWRRLFPDKPAVHIEGDYNTYVQVVSNKFGTSAEVLERVLENIVGKKDTTALRKSAGDFFRPAKRGGNSAIEVVGTPGISAKAVEEFPNDATLESLEDDRSDQFQNVEIAFHAWDIDKNKSGWAVHLPGLLDRRTKATLFPSVKMSTLTGVKRAKGDVIVNYRTDKNGNEIASIVHIVNILEILEGPANEKPA